MFILASFKQSIDQHKHCKWVPVYFLLKCLLMLTGSTQGLKLLSLKQNSNEKVYIANVFPV